MGATPAGRSLVPPAGSCLAADRGATSARPYGGIPLTWSGWAPSPHGAGRKLKCDNITCMRTTISLDDDVLLAVQERARREKRTAGEVLSDLARQALTGQHRQTEQLGAEQHGFRPLPRRGAAISNAFIDRLLEDEPG